MYPKIHIKVNLGEKKKLKKSMDEINNFLDFLYDNIEDERIEVSKKMKYGFRHYFITLCVQTDIDNGDRKSYTTYSTMKVHIDDRNKCIELEVNMDSVILESEEMVNKWSSILEKYISDNLDRSVSKLVDGFLHNTDRDLMREYKMRKITK